jgi:CBS domain-containing protein
MSSDDGRDEREGTDEVGGEFRWPTLTPADPVASIMVPAVLTVDGGASLRQVAAALHQGGVGALVVTENDRPTGIVSERDVVRALSEGGDPDSIWAADSMTPDPLWVDADQSIAEVAEQMRLHEIRHVPVREHGELAGIVSMRDILDVLLPG